MRDWLEDYWIAFVLFALILVMIGGTAYLIHLDIKQWEEFKVKHNCKPVGHIAGSIQTGTGINPADGKPVIVTTSEPSKTGYLCDDGITYWR